MATIPNAPDGELTAPDGTEKIPVAKGTLDKFIQALNLAVGKLRETAGPTVLTLGSVADGEFLQRSGTNIAGGLVNAVPYKNLAVNGSMQVSQRAPGTSVTGKTAPGYYTVDKFLENIVSLGTWTVSQDTDVPAAQGFGYSLKMLVTTADAAPAAGAAVNLQHRMEGRNLQHLLKGTSSAKTVALSFWVKSSTTGTYVAEFVDITNNRQISKSFSIVSANTWEKKTFSFAGDTSGVITNDFNEGLRIIIWLASGSNFTSGTLNTSWAALVNANRAVGQVNLAAAINNYINITGFQPEVNPTATEFEFVPFDIDLLRCKRTCQKSFLYGTVPAQNAGVNLGEFRYTAPLAGAAAERAPAIYFDVPMRTIPTATSYNPGAANAEFRDYTAAADCSASTLTATPRTLEGQCTGAAGTAAGNSIRFHWLVEADL